MKSAKRPVGRPRKNINPEIVEALARIQCTDSEIAAVLDVNERTIQRNFAAILKKGREAGKQSLKRMQYKLAEEGNATMQIWLGKQYLGQKDKVENEHTGANGGPISVNATHRVASFNWEAFRQELEHQIQRAMGQDGGNHSEGDGT